MNNKNSNGPLMYGDDVLMVTEGHQSERVQETMTYAMKLNRKEIRQIVRAVNDERKSKINQVMMDNRHQLKNVYLSQSGKLCMITLDEDTPAVITFLGLKNSYGENKKYDPNHEAQRRDKQHSKQKQLNMLISCLSKERIGNIILKKTDDNRFEIIDGRQRTSIVYNFLKSELTLTGKHSKDFWKLYLNDDFLYNENLESEDSLIRNKVLSKIENGQFPTVKFDKLPSIIQQDILNNFLLNGIVVNPEVKYVSNKEIVQPEDLDMGEVNDAIIRKFVDINDSSKPVSNEDILWAATSDPILQSRKFLDTLPSLFELLSYNLENKIIYNRLVLDDTNESRKLATLLGRAQMLFQGTLNWGAGPAKLRSLVLETDDTKFDDKTKYAWRFLTGVDNKKPNLENLIFKQTYIERDTEKSLQVPEEFKSSRRDVLVVMLLTSLMHLSDYILTKQSEDEYWMVKEKLLVGGMATRKFFKWVETIMVYLTLGKLANIDYQEWNREDLPLVKYNLTKEFYSTDIFDGIEIGSLMKKVKDLNQHQEGLSKDSENTFKTLIKYCETKI